MARPVISSLINHFVNSRPQLFKRWITLYTGLITFERIRVRETNCVTQWIEIGQCYPATV